MLALHLRERDPGHNDAGYSLMEVLLALAIFALIVSVAGGLGIRALNAQSERTERRQIIQSLEMMKYRSVVEERNIQIASFSDWPADTEMPNANWILQATPPLLINMAGQCSETEIVLTSPRERSYRYRVTSDGCTLVPL